MRNILQPVLLLWIGIIFPAGVWAQQAPHYTNFMYNMNVVNPAYTGIKNGLAGGILYRTQWVGADLHPATLSMNLHSRIGERSGLGLSGYMDKYGPAQQQDVMLGYSYTLPLGSVNLALGLDVGLARDFVDFGLLTAIDPDDDLLRENPDVMSVIYGVGVMLYGENFYVSLSAPNFNQSPFDKANSAYTQGRTVHYFGAAGYVWAINESFKLKPHVMVYKANRTPLSTMLNLNLFMYDKVELGVSYRLKDAVSGLINFKLTENVRIGYAYDRTLSSMKLYSPNTHEVFLNFVIPFQRKGFMSPLYF